MPERGFPYSESVLHWVWSEYLYDPKHLKTTSGLRVQILDPGQLNTTDGPDFQNARVRIGELLWSGAIEIHRNSAGWKQHGHHYDPNYNNVILHVVAEQEPHPVLTQSGEQLPTLNLFPYLDPQLRVFLKELVLGNQLPCSSTIRYLSQEAFQDQIDKAHHEYLEQKIQDFFNFFETGKLLSRSWKEALTLSLYDGLGISGNRKQMQQLGRYLLAGAERSIDQILQDAHTYAFGSEAEIRWNLKSSRGANHPKYRIPQGIRLMKIILNEPFEAFLDISNLTQYWESLLYRAAIKETPRFHILYGTVFLPSVYALSKLFAHDSLGQHCLENWRNLRTPLPDFINSYFATRSSNAPQLQKLGAVHQFRHYCKSGRCSDCLVLKKVIQG